MIRGVTSPVGVFAAGFRWGAVTGTTAGELLRVGYSGATVVGAELELGDGRVLSVIVGAGELSVLLPPDTPDGPATLRAMLSDGTIEELVIVLHGVVVVVEPPGWVTPPRRAQPPRRTVTSPSRIVLRTRTAVRPAPVRAPATVALRTGTRRIELRPGAVDRVLRSPSRVVIHAPTRVSAANARSGALVIRSGTRVARRDGEEIEALLLLELL